MRASLEEALAELASCDERYLFFDYDGTLSPLARRAADAVSHPDALAHLDTLSCLSGTTVGVVTGRPIEDIRIRVPLPAIVFAALHGFIIEGPGISMTEPGALRAQPALRRAVDRLKDSLRGLSGVDVEDKGLTVAVHFRRASRRDAEHAAQESRRISDQETGIRYLEGKEVVELRPDVDWDKGRAVEFIVEQLAGSAWRGRVGLLYAGDDQTDEDAFRRLGAKAVTVRVGEEGDTLAQHLVEAPQDVIDLMGRLASLIR
jgi:trehalose 6-phosphate phosphatase